MFIFTVVCFIACSTKNITELKSRTAAFEEVPECVQFDKLRKHRKMDCAADEDCFEIAMPRDPECYVPLTGNISGKDALQDLSTKCAARYKDEKLCDMPIPQKPVCVKNRCELVSK